MHTFEGLVKSYKTNEKTNCKLLTGLVYNKPLPYYHNFICDFTIIKSWSYFPYNITIMAFVNIL